MSIPLVQKAEKDDINTSIIAIKRYIDRINQLLGLSDSGGSDPDLSGLATKQELQDAVNSLQPVDEVTLNNMQSVTSNAVAQAMSYSTTEHFTGKYWVDGKKIYEKTTIVRQNGTNNPNITQSGTTYTIANDYFSQNEETVIKAVAHAKRSTGIWDTIISGSADIYCILISSNSIGFKFSGVTNTYIYVTIEYTKTTD